MPVKITMFEDGSAQIAITGKLAREAAAVGLTSEAIEALIALEIIRRREEKLGNDPGGHDAEDEKERLEWEELKRKYSRILADNRNRARKRLPKEQA